MRVRNLSNVAIDRKLLDALARGFGLGGKLPQALADDVGLYVGQSLRVTVRPRLHRPERHPSGTYTTGHITLYPCPSCSAAWVVAIYLHELFHAWVSQVDPRLYMRTSHCH